MVMPNISVPQYPNVPRAPGVPNILRSVNEVVNTTVLLAADAAILIRQFASVPQWGIFTASGQPVITGDSVVSMEYRRDYRIADFPIEQGSFESYNKVTQPYEIQLIFAVTGQAGFFSTFLSGGAIGALISGTTPNQIARAEFLTQLDTAAASLEMFSVVTPEKTYQGVNIMHADLRREARSGGATLLKVEVWLQEIRVTAKPAFSGSGTDPIDATPPPPTTNAADPAAQPAQNNGQVQGTSLSTTQQGALPDGAGQGKNATLTSGTGSPVAGETQPYFDANGNQLGIAPTATPASGPIVGEYANGQPVIGGPWQKGFFDSNNNWIHP